MRQWSWRIVGTGLLMFAIILSASAQEEADDVQAPLVEEPGGEPAVEPAPSPEPLAPTPTGTPVPTPAPPPTPTPIPAARCAVVTPWPADFAVTPPAPDVPTALARFIGVWEGTWDTGLVTRVGFEQISTDRAVGIYAYPTQPGFQGTTIQAGWQRFAGQINGDSVVWNASGFTAIFKPSADAGSLLGERQITNPNLISRASLSRCSPG